MIAGELSVAAGLSITKCEKHVAALALRQIDYVWPRGSKKRLSPLMSAKAFKKTFQDRKDIPLSPDSMRAPSQRRPVRARSAAPPPLQNTSERGNLAPDHLADGTSDLRKRKAEQPFYNRRGKASIFDTLPEDKKALLEKYDQNLNVEPHHQTVTRTAAQVLDVRELEVLMLGALLKRRQLKTPAEIAELMQLDESVVRDHAAKAKQKVVNAAEEKSLKAIEHVSLELYEGKPAKIQRPREAGKNKGKEASHRVKLGASVKHDISPEDRSLLEKLAHKSLPPEGAAAFVALCLASLEEQRVMIESAVDGLAQHADKDGMQALTRVFPGLIKDRASKQPPDASPKESIKFPPPEWNEGLSRIFKKESEKVPASTFARQVFEDITNPGLAIVAPEEAEALTICTLRRSNLREKKPGPEMLAAWNRAAEKMKTFYENRGQEWDAELAGFISYQQELRANRAPA